MNGDTRVAELSRSTGAMACSNVNGNGCGLLTKSAMSRPARTAVSSRGKGRNGCF